ncbi:MAG: hypothetical protein KF681_10565 [Bdellovibrionaceae bacterium]|nr:hypothetical protein [Pseudobdellovibrionaceae bacterium]
MKFSLKELIFTIAVMLIVSTVVVVSKTQAQTGIPYNSGYWWWYTYVMRPGDTGCYGFSNGCSGNTMMVPNGTAAGWDSAVNSSPGCLGKAYGDLCSCNGAYCSGYSGYYGGGDGGGDGGA